MSLWTRGLPEIAAALDAVDDAGLEAACASIAAAGAVVLYGCGREGLMMRALAMRLHHLGLRVAMQGDMACPPVGPGDLLLASAGPGRLATVTALLGVARAAGAGTLLLTAEPGRAPEGPVLVIPARTMAQGEGGTLPMGSLYEGAMFFLFEEMVDRLRLRLGETAETMRARHANLE